MALAAMLLSASGARAQATRTWVSGVGDDVNPCSRTAPCKTFAGAISKTAVGGEINVIDSGGFGAVTITKSVTISGEPFLSGVLAAGTNGINVGSAVGNESIIVTLRNLDINGVGSSVSPGLFGIRMFRGAALHIENCQIYGFRTQGVSIEPSVAPPGGASVKVHIKDTIIRNSGQLGTTPGGGILVKSTNGVLVDVSFDNVRLETNVAFGLRAEDNSNVVVNHSVSNGNGTNGFLIFSAAAASNLTLVDTVASGNGAFGVQAAGANATARLAGVTITRNATGMGATGSGRILSWGNNNNDGNTVNGAPTAAVIPQQ
jgi:hypothetical protein